MRLLRVYPAAWRARYGEELASLIEELEDTGRLSWRIRLDVMRAGVVERGRVVGLHGLSPRDRAREGSLLVLYAWMVFVVGGFGVQRASEHWRAVAPTAKQALPAGAFEALIVAAAVGSLVVLLGLALSLPALGALVRRGGWVEIRAPILRATGLSLLLVVATVGLAGWARALTPAARNGHNVAYGGAFLAWVALLAVCLLAWATAAATTARHLSFSAALLRVEVWLGASAAVAMALMTTATALWWGSLASSAPWFFDGRAPGSPGSALVPNMIVPTVVMLCATALGLIGATRAVSALRTVSGPPQPR